MLHIDKWSGITEEGTGVPAIICLCGDDKRQNYSLLLTDLQARVSGSCSTALLASRSSVKAFMRQIFCPINHTRCSS